MLQAKRYSQNPILSPSGENNWEAEAVFNCCPIKTGSKLHLVYRAIAAPKIHNGVELELSTIGYASGKDYYHFSDRRQLIVPQYDWEKYGCEDPRVAKVNGRYFIFYTALSDYPHSAEGIKVGLAITKDFEQIERKYLVTNFNSKAMSLFPERIKGRLAAILTTDTDKPPATIGIAFFDEVDNIWSRNYWDNWYSNRQKYAIDLQRGNYDHIEIGAPPLKTKEGWLLIYCYIKDYQSSQPIFGIEAALLDLENPTEVLGVLTKPILVPKNARAPCL